VIYEYFTQAPWDYQRWPNFQPAEIACPHCGETFVDDSSEWLLDVVQRVRRDFNRPIQINSGHRCAFYNASSIRGAAFSEHKVRIALDISLRGHDPAQLYQSLVKKNISTFGFYSSFIHIDARKGRRWYSKEGRKRWNGLVIS
jgi:uncharacterized protein YcbK (DUF882 family)|tara:strand:- start:145 stop:573 length:429 start_codon:yes stop_codon:yes gene_type:complete